MSENLTQISCNEIMVHIGHELIKIISKLQRLTMIIQLYANDNVN